MNRREVRRRLRRLGDAQNWEMGELGRAPVHRRRDDLVVVRRRREVLVTVVVGAFVVLVSAAVIGHRIVLPRPATSSAAAPTSVGSTDVPTPVPWVSASPSPALTPAPVTAPACTAADFEVTAHLEGTVMGYTQSPVYLVQTSRDPCALSGEFVLDSIRGGIRVPAARLPIATVGTTDSLSPATGAGYVIPPRMRLMLRITGTAPGNETVGTYDRPAWLRINGTYVRLPGGELPSRVVDHGLSLTAEAPPSPQDSGTGPYSALRARIELAQTPKAHSVLQYVVTLRNTGQTDFVFTGACPNYAEAINVFAAGHKEGRIQRYALNCTGVRIAAGSSASFAMQIAVPDATGTVGLFWGLDNGPSDATQTSTK